MTALRAEGRLFHSDQSKRRTFSSYSNIPAKFVDDRQKELDQILKQLYEGKRLKCIQHDRHSSASSEASVKPSLVDEVPRNDDLFSLDGDLHRELQEKDLDIRHLHKELQELQLENKLLRAQLPSNSRSTHTLNEIDVLHNELRVARETIAKLQQQTPSLVVTRSNAFDEEKESWRRKLRDYEKRLRLLTGENEKWKQNCQQAERTISQLKREKEELQDRVRRPFTGQGQLTDERNDVTEATKRNDELFIQELHSLRNDLKMLKERNHQLVEENESFNQQPATSSRWKTTNQREAKVVVSTSDSSTDNDSKHDLTLKYSNGHQQQYSRPMRYQSIINNDDTYSISYPYSKSLHSQVHYRPATNDRRPTRPYAPLSISDIRLNDLVKFSRPGGKISKGIVKYIGILPDRSDDYLGLELDDEDGQHDGVFQGQRLFQCKPNKGVFVGFSRVIMAWSGQ